MSFSPDYLGTPIRTRAQYGTSYYLITIHTELQLAAFLLCRIALST